MPTVLIVDDSKLDRDIAGDCASKHGYATVFATDGLEALASIDANRPDVVLTDLVMPELDGLGLVDRIRRRYPSIPVVLMTGKGTDGTAVEALSAGAASYIPKNVLHSSLRETLQSVLLARQAVARKNREWNFLSYRESHYVVGYEELARSTLIGYFQDELARMEFCDDADLIRVGTALAESLANAVEHGNLELDSCLREEENTRYYEVGRHRSYVDPFSSRRVRVSTRATPAELIYVVEDEGPGFNYETLPDPTDPANLVKLSGRGLLLIRTFMDEVRFNRKGNQITMVKRRSLGGPC